MRLGAALAGCSAGAIALTGWVPGFRSPEREPDPGLGVLPVMRLLPHFDRMLGWAPELVARSTADTDPGTSVIGVDEDTAIVDMTGSGHSWQVYGRQQAWELTDGSRRGYPAGSWLTTP